MRTPFCFACAGVLLVGALALGNPFLVTARPRASLKAAPARGAAPLAAAVVETSPPQPVPPGPRQAVPAVDRLPADVLPFPDPAAAKAASGPGNGGKRDAGVQPAVLIGSAGGNAVGGSVVGGSVGAGSDVVGGSDPGPGPEFEGLVVRSDRDADGHLQWLLKDGRLLRRQGNRVVEVPREGIQR